jgi:membrane protease YdiL (CAAX protease family)
MAAATYLLYLLYSGVAPFVARDTALLYSAFRAPSPAAVVLAFLPVIFGEELVWRGVVQAEPRAASGRREAPLWRPGFMRSRTRHWPRRSWFSPR